jgi:hypothetical protein
MLCVVLATIAMSNPDSSVRATRSTALKNGGIPGEADYLGSHIASYRGLPTKLNVPNPPPLGVYEVPK